MVGIDPEWSPGLGTNGNSCPPSTNASSGPSKASSGPSTTPKKHKPHFRQSNHHGPDPSRKRLNVQQKTPLTPSKLDPNRMSEVGPRDGPIEDVWGEKRWDEQNNSYFNYWSMDKFEVWVTHHWRTLSKLERVCIDIIRSLIQNPSKWPDKNKTGQGLERHHLIPRSRGGYPKFPKENTDWCISLTYAHHLIIHVCYATIFPSCVSLSFSVTKMTFGTGGIDLTKIITEAGADQTLADQYQKLRMKRAPMSEATKIKISKKRMGVAHSTATCKAISTTLSLFTREQQLDLIKLYLKSSIQHGRYLWEHLLASPEFKNTVPKDLHGKAQPHIQNLRRKNFSKYHELMLEAVSDQPELAESFHVKAAAEKAKAEKAKESSGPKKSKVVKSSNASDRPKKSEESKKSKVVKSSNASDRPKKSEESFHELKINEWESEDEDEFDESDLGPEEEEEDSKLPARVSFESKRPRRSSTMNVSYFDENSFLDQYLKQQEEEKENAPSKRIRQTVKRVSYN